MYPSVVLTILLLGTWSVLAIDPPVLGPLSVPKDLTIGTPVRLVCSATTGTTPLEWIWMKDGQRLKNLPSISIEDSTYTSTLMFKPVSEVHNGKYSCYAGNHAGNHTVFVDVIVNVPPVWVTKPEDVLLQEGKEMVLHCDVKGSPTPAVTWTKKTDNVEIKINSDGRWKIFPNGTLIVQNSLKSDAGIYICEAGNGIGQNLKESALVKIFTMPRAMVKKQYETVQRGKNVTLECSSTGDHPLNIIWIKDERTLDPTKKLYDRIDISDKNDEEHLISTLVISQPQKADGGHYTCVARNEFGEDRKSIRLVILQPPQKPSDLKVSFTWSRSVRIQWKPESGSIVTTYLIQYWSFRDNNKINETVQGGITTALIKGLHPSTGYKLHMFATNSIGSSDPSQIIEFNTTEEEPSAAPVNVRIENTGATHILVTWFPPPESDWNGELKGYYVGYHTSGSSSQYSYHTVSAQDRSFTLRGLQKGTSYSIIVKAFNVVGTGPPSEEMTVITQDGDYPPPPLLSIATMDATSLKLHWMLTSPSRQRITGYTLHYRKEGDSWKEIFISSGSQTSYHLKHMQTGVVYNLYLDAHSQYGTSEPSDALTVVLTEVKATSQPSKIEDNELKQILYIIVPIVAATIIIVLIVVAVCFYLYIKKTRPPPPPVYADFPRDTEFTFTSTIARGSLDPALQYATTSRIKKKGTPYSTMQRSDGDSIYESIGDLRTLRKVGEQKLTLANLPIETV